MATSFSATARILGPWTATAHCSRASPSSPSGRRSCSTSTASSRRSSTCRTRPPCPRRRARSSAGCTGRYALVACISGRSGADARRVVGLDELVYVGEHGLELEPEALAWSERLQQFAATVDWDDVERKPLTVSFHYRRADDEEEALAMLSAVATRARHEGLVARFGRKVLELRPPVGAHKGTAVTHLLGERGLERALYAGDDTTDLDAFDAVGALELGVRVAVASAEGPPELREAADIVVGGPAEMRAAAAAALGGRTGAASGAAAISSCRISTSAATTPASAIAAPTQNASWKPDVSASGCAAPDANSFSVRRDRDRREQRDPDCAADLLRRVDQTRRDPGLGLADAGERRDRDRHEAERHPERDDQEARQQVGRRTSRRPGSA